LAWRDRRCGLSKDSFSDNFWAYHTQLQSRKRLSPALSDILPSITSPIPALRSIVNYHSITTYVTSTLANTIATSSTISLTPAADSSSTPASKSTTYTYVMVITSTLAVIPIPASSSSLTTLVIYVTAQPLKPLRIREQHPSTVFNCNLYAILNRIKS
jgi:hypothetical protein